MGERFGGGSTQETVCMCLPRGKQNVQGSSAHWDRGDQQSIWFKAKCFPGVEASTETKDREAGVMGPASCLRRRSSPCRASLTLLLAHLPRQSSLLPR